MRFHFAILRLRTPPITRVSTRRSPAIPALALADSPCQHSSSFSSLFPPSRVPCQSPSKYHCSKRAPSTAGQPSHAHASPQYLDLRFQSDPTHKDSTQTNHGPPPSPKRVSRLRCNKGLNIPTRPGAQAPIIQPPKAVQNHLHPLHLRPSRLQPPTGHSRRHCPRHSRRHRRPPLPHLPRPEPRRPGTRELLVHNRRRRGRCAQPARALVSPALRGH